MLGYQSSWLEDHPDAKADLAGKEQTLQEALNLAAGKNDHVPNMELVKSVKMVPKIKKLFEGEATYRCAYGGRGSGKSQNFGLEAALRGYIRKEKILCAREIQKTIEKSVMAQIVAAIEEYPFLASFYEVGRSYIRGKNGTEFLFMGIAHNVAEIKSTYGITICWVEEAEAVSEYSWRTLIPTIRTDDSEIWATWNPESSDSETHKMFIDNPPEGAKVIKVNWTDNPWFPKTLEARRQHDLKGDRDLYDHIWEGECITKTEAQIFWDKCNITDFEPHNLWQGPYYGLDFGFSNSPTAAVEVYIGDNQLWIRKEAGGRKLELDDTAKLMINKLPGIEKHVIRADNARPESISHLKRKGLPRIVACEKGPGSVEDGITYIRNFDSINIHTDCTELQKEARLYSYKVDRITGDVLPIIIKMYDNYWDSVRYGIEPMIKSNYNDYGKYL